MTPKEAVDQFLKADMRTVTKGSLRMLFESVASTAHDKETRRCAKVAREMTMGETDMHYGPATANKILTTGGLEIEP